MDLLDVQPDSLAGISSAFFWRERAVDDGARFPVTGHCNWRQPVAVDPSRPIIDPANRPRGIAETALARKQMSHVTVGIGDRTDRMHRQCAGASQCKTGRLDFTEMNERRAAYDKDLRAQLDTLHHTRTVENVIT